MNKIGIAISAGFVLLNQAVFAETLDIIQLGRNHCAYEGSHRITSGPLRLFSSDNEAEQVANRILRQHGMSLSNAGFVLKAAIGDRIRNAAAEVQGSKRYLLYKQSFIQDANRRAGTEWAGVSIMAHEIAHHILGHTLLGGGSQPDEELFADKWSGFVLYKLGASRDEATAAMRVLVPLNGSPTHPGRAERVDAIIHGWTNARELASGGHNSGTPIPRSFVREVPATSARSSNNVNHSHNGRSHAHPLPAEGANHQHSGQATQPMVSPTPAPRTLQVPEPEMVFIRGGTFMVGSPRSEKGRDSNEQQRSVRVGDFHLGKMEVTVGEFKRFVQANNYKTVAESSGKGCNVWIGSARKESKANHWRNPGFKQSDRHPVTCVSEADAVAYAQWLSNATGKRYTLPTEVQWEYAARAGTTTSRYWGETPDQTCQFANVADQMAKKQFNWIGTHGCNDGVVRTAPVGRYRANRFGLHDMMGNVWEWTQPSPGAKRILRGGAWNSPPESVRSAKRHVSTASYRSDRLGFRLSQTP